MFEYPAKAEFNRTLPKSKIYAFAKPGRAVRDRFVSQVAEVIWQYKLSPETVNLPARDGIHEIQIFRVAVKTADLAEDVLRTIDRAIPSPIFFTLSFDSKCVWQLHLAHLWQFNLAHPGVEVEVSVFVLTF